MNPGGKSGQVYVAVEGDEAEEASTLEGLIAARGYIHSVLLDRMGVKRIPDLTFHIDRSEKDDRPARHHPGTASKNGSAKVRRDR